MTGYSIKIPSWEGEGWVEKIASLASLDRNDGVLNKDPLLGGGGVG